MKEILRIFLEAAIMSAGLLLVIITLSGSTRDMAIGISIASVIFFVLSQMVPPKGD